MEYEQENIFPGDTVCIKDNGVVVRKFWPTPRELGIKGITALGGEEGPKLLD